MKQQKNVGLLMGAALAAMLSTKRMANQMGSVFYTSFRGVGRKSSLINRSGGKQYKVMSGSSEQECFRRRNGGFYDVRKRSMFP